jgi:hypothetical protein
LDVAEPHNPERLFETVRDLMQAASKVGKVGHPRLALCGERAGHLWAEGKIDDAMRIERVCDDLAKTHDVDVLCAYPLGTFAAEQDEQSFERICATHSALSYR